MDMLKIKMSAEKSDKMAANAKKASIDLDLYHLLNPLYLWTALMGLTPFAPRRSGFVPSKWHLCLSLMLVLLYMSISVKSIIDKRSDVAEGRIALIMDQLELYTSNINMVVVVVFACLQRNKILAVIDAIYKCDLHIKHTFPQVDFQYKRAMIWLYAILVALNVYIAVSYVIDVIVFYKGDVFTSMRSSFTYFCPKLIVTHMVVHYCCLNVTLRRRFAILNAQLDTLTGDASDPSDHLDFILKDITRIHVISNGRQVEIIESIRMQHFKLCDIAMVLNRAYGSQILFTALHVFMTLLSSIFWCIRTVGLKPQTRHGENSIVLVFYTLNVIFHSFAQLWACVSNASNTDFEARKTGSIVHKFKVDKITPHLEFELIYFSLQLNHQKVDFNALRMFKLDESVLLSVIGVICTYLVIVIQFEFTALNS